MRLNRFVPALLALCSMPVLAQTGPMHSRAVASAIPALGAAKLLPEGGLKTVVELSIDATGKVTDVTLLEPSSKPEFDERVKQYYSKWRFIPELDATGTPIASKYKMGLKYIKATDNSRARVADPKQERVYDEAARIDAMTCKDFLWEYDFMKKIAGSKLKPLNEELVRTSLAMYITEHKTSPADLEVISGKFNGALQTIVKQCRATPGEKYHESVFAPTLSAQLAR